jgi:hypothetical protein
MNGSDKTTASIVGHVILSLAAMAGTYAACWSGFMAWTWWLLLCGAMLGFVPVAVAMSHYSRAINAMASVMQPGMQPGVQVQVQPALPPVVQVQVQPDAPPAVQPAVQPASATPSGVHQVQPSTVPTPGVGGLVTLLATLGALGMQHARHIVGPLSMLFVLTLAGCAGAGTTPGAAIWKTLDAIRLACSAEPVVRTVVTMAVPPPTLAADAGTDPDAPIR